MKIYFVISDLKETAKVGHSNFHILISYHYIKNKEMENNFYKPFKGFILDSGIFTFLNGKDVKDIDWDEYAFNYGNFVKKYDIKQYIELDLYKIIGIEETEKLRKKIEKYSGARTIPVWHKITGLDYWNKLLKLYDYIAIGGIVTKDIKPSEYKYIQKMVNSANEQGKKIHGLGFTSMKWLPKIKFYSVDSSSYTAGQRFGFIYVYKDGKVIQYKPKDKKLKTGLAGRLHNFKEWIKFSDYAEKNL